MSIFFKRMHDTMNPSEDAIWCPIPDEVQAAIKRWQQMLVSAVPVAKLNGNLVIGMMAGLFNFDRDLPKIINTASHATPAQAMLLRLESRRINEITTSLVITVDCPELKELHDRLQGVVAYPVDAMGPYIACIEIARFDNMVNDLEGLQDIEAHGLTRVKWIISEIYAGTEHSYCECGLLGHVPMKLGVESIGSTIFEKAAGMSTMDMASGGALLGGNDFSIDVEDDEDEDDEESEDGWMARALEFTDSLEGY